MKDNFTTVEKLTAFVNQKPGLKPEDYTDSQSYNRASKELTRQRNDYFELLSLFLARYGGSAELVLIATLDNEGATLRLAEDGMIYFNDLKYRPAANRLLASLIRQSFTQEKDRTQSLMYSTDLQVRAAIEARVSNRVMKLYFN